MKITEALVKDTLISLPVFLLLYRFLRLPSLALASSLIFVSLPTHLSSFDPSLSVFIGTVCLILTILFALVS